MQGILARRRTYSQEGVLVLYSARESLPVLHLHIQVCLAAFSWLAMNSAPHPLPLAEQPCGPLRGVAAYRFPALCGAPRRAARMGMVSRWAGSQGRASTSLSAPDHLPLALAPLPHGGRGEGGERVRTASRHHLTDARSWRPTWICTQSEALEEKGLSQVARIAASRKKGPSTGTSPG